MTTHENADKPQGAWTEADVEACRRLLGIDPPDPDAADDGDFDPAALARRTRR